jgi:hypothetical protein
LPLPSAGPAWPRPELPFAIKPVTLEYRGISATISTELDKLRAASVQLQQHNAELFVQERVNSWLWQGMCAVVLFFVGGLCGLLWEKREITSP